MSDNSMSDNSMSDTGLRAIGKVGNDVVDAIGGLF